MVREELRGSQGGGLLGWFKGLLKGKDKDKVASPLKGNSRKRIVADPGSPASQGAAGTDRGSRPSSPAQVDVQGGARPNLLRTQTWMAHREHSISGVSARGGQRVDGVEECNISVADAPAAKGANARRTNTSYRAIALSDEAETRKANPSGGLTAVEALDPDSTQHSFVGQPRGKAERSPSSEPSSRSADNVPRIVPGRKDSDPSSGGDYTPTHRMPGGYGSDTEIGHDPRGSGQGTGGGRGGGRRPSSALRQRAAANCAAQHGKSRLGSNANTETRTQVREQHHQSATHHHDVEDVEDVEVAEDLGPGGAPMPASMRSHRETESREELRRHSRQETTEQMRTRPAQGRHPGGVEHVVEERETRTEERLHECTQEESTQHGSRSTNSRMSRYSHSQTQSHHTSWRVKTVTHTGVQDTLVREATTTGVAPAAGTAAAAAAAGQSSPPYRSAPAAAPAPASAPAPAAVPAQVDDTFVSRPRYAATAAAAAAAAEAAVASGKVPDLGNWNKGMSRASGNGAALGGSEALPPGRSLVQQCSVPTPSMRRSQPGESPMPYQQPMRASYSGSPQAQQPAAGPYFGPSAADRRRQQAAAAAAAADAESEAAAMPESAAAQQAAQQAAAGRTSPGAGDAAVGGGGPPASGARMYKRQSTLTEEGLLHMGGAHPYMGVDSRIDIISRFLEDATDGTTKNGLGVVAPPPMTPGASSAASAPTPVMHDGVRAHAGPPPAPPPGRRVTEQHYQQSAQHPPPQRYSDEQQRYGDGYSARPLSRMGPYPTAAATPPRPVQQQRRHQHSTTTTAHHTTEIRSSTVTHTDKYNNNVHQNETQQQESQQHHTATHTTTTTTTSQSPPPQKPDRARAPHASSPYTQQNPYAGQYQPPQKHHPQPPTVATRGSSSGRHVSSSGYDAPQPQPDRHSAPQHYRQEQQSPFQPPAQGPGAAASAPHERGVDQRPEPAQLAQEAPATTREYLVEDPDDDPGPEDPLLDQEAEEEEQEDEEQWDGAGGGVKKHRRRRVRIASAWRRGQGGGDGRGGGGQRLATRGGYRDAGDDGDGLPAWDSYGGNGRSFASGKSFARTSPPRMRGVTASGNGERTSDGLTDADLYDKYDTSSRALAAQAPLMRTSRLRTAMDAATVQPAALNPLLWQVGSSSANATSNFGAGFQDYGGFGGGGGGGSPPQIGSESFGRRTSRRHLSMPGNGDGIPPRTAGATRDRSPGAVVHMDRDRDRERDRDRSHRDRSPGGGGLGGFDRNRDRGFGGMGSMGMGMGMGVGMGMGMSGGGITGRLNLGLGAGLAGIMGAFGGRRMRDPLPPPWATNDYDY